MIHTRLLISFVFIKVGQYFKNKVKSFTIDLQMVKGYSLLDDSLEYHLQGSLGFNLGLLCKQFCFCFVQTVFLFSVYEAGGWGGGQESSCTCFYCFLQSQCHCSLKMEQIGDGSLSLFRQKKHVYAAIELYALKKFHTCTYPTTLNLNSMLSIICSETCQ